MKMFIRALKKIAIFIIAISLAFMASIYFITRTESSNENPVKEKEESTNIYRRDTICYTKRVQEAFDSTSQLNILTEKGYITISHDKTPDGSALKKYLMKSNIFLKVKYKASISMNTRDINVSLDENEILLKYDTDDMFISSVQIDDVAITDDHGIFGKVYTSREATLLILASKELISKQIIEDESLIVMAEFNLRHDLQMTCWKLGIFNIKLERK